MAGERWRLMGCCLPAAIAGLLLASADVARAAGDIVAGEAKSEACVGCHGRNGRSIHPRYPHLAGQKEYYLIKSMRAYREGSRTDPAMTPFAAGWSDADIADLAAFFSRFE